MTPETSKIIFAKLKKFYGEVKPGLNFRNLYELSVSVALSAQTTDRQVNTAAPALFKKYPGFAELARAKQSDIERIIKSTGFYKNKAKNIIGLAVDVMEKHDGVLPGEFDALIRLPGIGRKTANVILSAGFNVPALAVDTHVLRIANRLGYVDSDRPLDAETALTENIPQKDWSEAHLLLIHHGRKTCSARRPKCGLCPVSGLCPSREEMT